MRPGAGALAARAGGAAGWWLQRAGGWPLGCGAAGGGVGGGAGARLSSYGCPLARTLPCTPCSPCSALKTKGNTPKYGLIFHSSFIGRAKQRNKGRIRWAGSRGARARAGCGRSSTRACALASHTPPVLPCPTNQPCPACLHVPRCPRSRYLANKCSIASRIDCFMEASTDAFGKKLKDQVGGVVGP